MTPKRRKIIIVDDSEANLTVGKNMLKTFHEVFPVSSAAKMFTLLEKFIPDLILLDIEMPEMDGYQAISVLKADQRFCDIPIIFLTSMNDEHSELKGLSLGAIDYVYKPFSASLLLKRIDNHLLIASQQRELKQFNENLEEMVEQKVSELNHLKDAILHIVAEIVEYRDDITGGHVSRTTSYFKLLMDRILEKGLYIDETCYWNTQLLAASTQLHDVGKVAIPDAILNKPGKLSEEEFAIMKNHVQLGVEMIERIEQNTGTEEQFLNSAKIIAGTHHEKWDGSGYPMGLREEFIPVEGRMMAIVDVYDALIARRPYKDPMSSDRAKAIILENRGTHFDPTLVDVFEELADDFARIATAHMTSRTTTHGLQEII
ncbi:MAG: response regulator [Coriobacteriales bacterium]|jgi:putative two-component system response regulator|nr:response regulator [Coriobacteriales bacterium]